MIGSHPTRLTVVRIKEDIDSRIFLIHWSIPPWETWLTFKRKSWYLMFRLKAGGRSRTLPGVLWHTSWYLMFRLKAGGRSRTLPGVLWHTSWYLMFQSKVGGRSQSLGIISILFAIGILCWNPSRHTVGLCHWGRDGKCCQICGDKDFEGHVRVQA